MIKPKFKTTTPSDKTHSLKSMKFILMLKIS